MQFEANQRGIPKATFVASRPILIIAGKSRVFYYSGSSRRYYAKIQWCVEYNIEMISKFKYMETHLNQRKSSLESKIPEIKATLDMVKYLEKVDKPIDVQFEVNDTLWANAQVPKTNKVNLWLGANVMLEYTTEEANELLTSKLKAANTSLEQVLEDLEYLREQITTMEVNIARVYNYDVKNRREGKVKSADK